MPVGRGDLISMTPSASRLTTSLRDIGYDFASAVADLADNSVAAGAQRIDISIEFEGLDSRVIVADDGYGMTENELVESLRFGSRREYDRGELGRYGLGLKTASLSQCRCVTVTSRRSPSRSHIPSRTLDLDLILEFDDWLIVDPGRTDLVRRAQDWLSDAPGTVVIWEKLDRVLPTRRPDGGWARRRLTNLADKVSRHLAMVFHRFLEGTENGRHVVITVNGEKLTPWNPFARSEPATVELSPQRFEINPAEGESGHVELRRFVLPSHDRFSSPAEFERLSGPLKWNRQQGLYIYRADRLVQWGGWAGVRAIDEHTKLARASLDFDTDLDSAFNINVAKMKVSLPPDLRKMLERPLHELCIRANGAYRRTPRQQAASEAAQQESAAESATLDRTGLALRSAAAQAGEYAAFKRVAETLRKQAPDIAEALGL
ncbi:ATP-binding protein [Saccharomonospora iraqiensis]|uniref:ATP-binding protein n=1 Tax=Saccharomonospora iraqiensis TaxID=52698 RepID=UPI00022DF48A|nr:ATP-binding protein [Saccharomonospora iraqiensis]